MDEEIISNNLECCVGFNNLDSDNFLIMGNEIEDLKENNLIKRNEIINVFNKIYSKKKEDTRNYRFDLYFGSHYSVKYKKID
jgi:hypothetical protein